MSDPNATAPESSNTYQRANDSDNPSDRPQTEPSDPAPRSDAGHASRPSRAWADASGAMKAFAELPVWEEVSRGATVHRLSIIVLLVLPFLVIGIPQIRALFSWPHGGFEWTALLISSVIGLLVYSVGWLSVLPIDDLRKSDEKLLGDDGSVPMRLHKRLQPVGRGIDRALEYFEHKPIVAALLCVASYAAFVLLTRESPLFFHAAILCSWLVLQRLRDNVLTLLRTPSASLVPATKLIGRAITVVLLSAVVLEVVWRMQPHLPDGLRYRIYSTWAVLQTLFALTLVVRVVDVLGLLRLPWVRVWPIAVILAVLGLLPAGEVVGRGAEISMTEATTALERSLHSRALARSVPRPNAWLEALASRLEEIPEDQPAILVAASGGGSRAAITAALVYEKLAHTFVQSAASDERRALTENVLLVSSVSGGSLASAHFVTRGPRRAGGPFVPEQSEIVRRMSTDFMAPLLRGVLTPGQERGAAVAEFWRDAFGWHRELSRDPATAGRPLLVLNATHVQSGTRVGFGFPALPASILRPALVAADLDPELEIDLADAVRMSANFPYGFEHALLGRLDDPKRPEIIDGGVVDNTGLDTLALVLAGVQRAAIEPAGESTLEEERRALSQRVRDGLIQRGMIVLEIDAGARPSDPSFLARRFPAITKPLEALSRAGHQNLASIRTQNLERMRSFLPPGLGSAPVGVVRAGFHCSDEGDVITAWALDTEARMQIFDDFKQTEARLERALDAHHDAIRALHCLRDHGIDSEDPAALSLASGALNLAYSDYLETALEVDATQHMSVPGCSSPEDAQKPGPAERALRERLASLACAPRPVRRATEQPPDELLSDASSAPPEPAKALPPRAGSKSDSSKPSPGIRPPAKQPAASSAKLAPRKPDVLGWIYLGQREGSTWSTKYASWEGGGEPGPGDIVRLLGRSHVRAEMPDENGQLAAATTTLPAKSELLVLQTRAWGESGFLWARVAVPPASTAPELLPVKQRAKPAY